VGNFLLLDLLSVPAPYGGDEEGILLVDLDATRRLLLFHSLQTPQGVASQGLILPLTVSLTKDECRRIEAHLGEVEKMGIVLRPVGQEKLLIDALPPYLAPEKTFAFAEESPKEILEDERERRLARLSADGAYR
jgi:DNA mismatch repair ATPase MutL